jgi:ribosomal RNA-processing protein 9
MPDSFFQSDKKRKRPDRSGGGGDTGSSSRGRGGSSRGSERGRGSGGRGSSRGGRGGRGGGDSGGGSYDKPFRPAAYGKGQKVQGQAKYAADRKSRAEGRSGGRDENLSSDAEGDDGGEVDDMDFTADQNRDRGDEEVIDENETGAEKRVRLARGYLRKVQDEVEAGRYHFKNGRVEAHILARDDQDYDAAEIDRELIAARLQKDVVGRYLFGHIRILTLQSETEGRIHTFLSSRPLTTVTKFLKLNNQIPTSLALTPTSIVVATKRGIMFRYALPTFQQIGRPFGQGSATAMTSNQYAAPTGHTGELFCVAASEDGRFIVSGGKDKLVGVWEVSEDGETVEWLTGMRGHKDAVTVCTLFPL